VYSRNFDLEDVTENFEKTGRDPTGVIERFKDKHRSKPLSSLYAEADSMSEESNDDELIEESQEEMKRHDKNEKRMDKKLRSMSRSRSKGTRREFTEQEENMDRLKKKIQNKLKKEAKKGEADRTILNLMPKHLFTGKRSNGKADRR